MTRLITEWIADIESTIKKKEEQLKSRTGMNYKALVAKASGCSVNDIERASWEIIIGVVPITTGLGMIGSFPQSVAAIAGAMGFRSFVTEHTDVDGIYEAYQKEADLIYIADDDRFIAMNLHKKKVADNNIATVAGYTAALEGMTGPLAGKEILVLGYGTLGKEFAKLLKKKGAAVTAYDNDPDKAELLDKSDIRLIRHPDEIKEFRFIIDATSEGGWLHQQHLHPEAWIVAPGVPLSLDPETYERYSDRVVHDCLEIGTATMLGMAL